MQSHSREVFDHFPEVIDIAVTVIEGKNLYQYCNQTQYPDEDVFWIKNGTDRGAAEFDPLLNITSISRSQAGEYLCEAYNRTSGINRTVEVLTVDVWCTLTCFFQAF